MHFALALIPVIILLVIIYLNDKKEKEPLGFLLALFFAGVGSCIPVIIVELLGELLLYLIMPDESVFKSYIIAILLVAPVEELGKYAALRLLSWNNKNFDYSYDAIVYAVFVSLGFAAIENVGYVFSNGLGTALIRMFTAVPGHASFGVFMGFFYSKAKYASVTGNKADQGKYTALSLICPIALHGIYDAILMGAGTTEELVFAGLSLLLWIGFTLLMFILSIVVVILASRNDFCIINMPGSGPACYYPAMAGSWICSCGTTGYLNYCSRCGQMRPVSNIWICPQCHTQCAFQFCGNCGFPKDHAVSTTYYTP